MSLTKTQQTIWEKARAYGSGDQAVGLTDEMCAYLVCRIVHDLGLQNTFPEVPRSVPPFFETDDLDSLVVPGVNAQGLFERLTKQNADADCTLPVYQPFTKLDSSMRPYSKHSQFQLLNR